MSTITLLPNPYPYDALPTHNLTITFVPSAVAALLDPQITRVEIVPSGGSPVTYTSGGAPGFVGSALAVELELPAFAAGITSAQVTVTAGNERVSATLTLLRGTLPTTIGPVITAVTLATTASPRSLPLPLAVFAA